MKLLLLALLSLLALSSYAHAENFSADVFDSSGKTRLYTLTQVEVRKGTTLHRDAVYKRADGTIAAQEKTDLLNGALQKYTVDYPPQHQSGTVEISGKKLLFSFTESGKTKTDHESLEKNTIVPPTTGDFIQAHLARLLKGKTLDTRFAAVDRRETIGFEFTHTGDETFQGHDCARIRMKPSSFFIAALVSPMIFIVDKSTGRLLKFKGRLLPKKQDGGDWKDQDGIIVYHYPDAGVKKAHPRSKH